MADTINHWTIQPCRTISDRDTWFHRGMRFVSPRLKMHCIRAQNTDMQWRKRHTNPLTPTLYRYLKKKE